MSLSLRIRAKWSPFLEFVVETECTEIVSIVMNPSRVLFATLAEEGHLVSELVIECMVRRVVRFYDEDWSCAQRNEVRNSYKKYKTEYFVRFY
jgi:hypothetical protein